MQMQGSTTCSTPGSCTCCFSTAVHEVHCLSLRHCPSDHTRVPQTFRFKQCSQQAHKLAGCKHTVTAAHASTHGSKQMSCSLLPPMHQQCCQDTQSTPCFFFPSSHDLTCPASAPAPAPVQATLSSKAYMRGERFDPTNPASLGFGAHAATPSSSSTTSSSYRLPPTMAGRSRGGSGARAAYGDYPNYPEGRPIFLPEAERFGNPPDLPSLLLQQRVIYISMPVRTCCCHLVLQPAACMRVMRNVHMASAVASVRRVDGSLVLESKGRLRKLHLATAVIDAILPEGACYVRVSPSNPASALA
jgi:hypothetical protein